MKWSIWSKLDEQPLTAIQELPLNLNVMDPRFQQTIYGLQRRQWSMVQNSSHQICILRKLADSFAPSSKPMLSLLPNTFQT